MKSNEITLPTRESGLLNLRGEGRTLYISCSGRSKVDIELYATNTTTSVNLVLFTTAQETVHQVDIFGYTVMNITGYNIEAQQLSIYATIL